MSYAEIDHGKLRFVDLGRPLLIAADLKQMSRAFSPFFLDIEESDEENWW